MEPQDIAEIQQWIAQAGQIATGYFNNVSATRKADWTPVTDADRSIEAFLSARLLARFPEHGILGEEATRHALDREFVWALDPLDGTAVFVAGLPIWGISLGLLRNGKPHFGICHLPLVNDWYLTNADGGAIFNNRPVAVTQNRWDSESWIAAPSNSHRSFNIDFPGKVRNLGSTMAALCYVARGSAVGALIWEPAIWDIAAGLALVEAAGGVAEYLSGRTFDPRILLNGDYLSEPILVGAVEQIAALRDCIQLR